MKNAFYLFLCLFVISCNQDPVFENPNFDGKNTGDLGGFGGGKVISSDVKFKVGDLDFDADKVLVYEENFISSVIEFTAKMGTNELSLTMSGEFTKDEEYDLNSSEPFVSMKYSVKSTTEGNDEVIEKLFDSGKIKILEFDRKTGIAKLEFSGVLNDMTVVEAGTIDVKFFPDSFEGTIAGDEFVRETGLVALTSLGGLKSLSIQISGTVKDKSSSIQIGLNGNSIKEGSHSLSVLSGNLATYGTFDPLELHISKGGKVNLLSYNEEEGYVRGTFEFSTDAGNVKGSFSLSYVPVDFDEIKDVLDGLEEK